jgi:DNA-binding PadR family transcriptional regulator
MDSYHHGCDQDDSDAPWFLAARRGHWGAAYGARFGGWGEWFGGPPPRAERGGVRYLVLNAIVDQPRHGYEIISVIEQKSRGAYRPSPGVVYPTLQMLEELEHTEAIEVEGRKVYAITAAGRKDLEEHRDEVIEFYDRLHQDSWDAQIEDFGELAKLFGQLIKTARRAARRGRLSTSTVNKIREIVGDAIKRVEQVLAGDDR